MVKKQNLAFVLDSTIEATRMRLTPREGYLMSSHYPLEKDPSWLPDLHAPLLSPFHSRTARNKLRLADKGSEFVGNLDQPLRNGQLSQVLVCH